MTDRYDADKEILGYVPDYRRIADALGPAARVCEIGVGHGASMRMWQDMYPQGLIAGVDLGQASVWPEGTIRIVISQNDPRLPGILREHSETWDLIIDDASHEGELTAVTFGQLWPLVAPDGFYVIEDWFFGLPQWRDTGCTTGYPPGSPEIASTYDPGMLGAVQSLITLLDEPFRGSAEGASAPRGTEVESITYRYGIVVVHKHASPQRPPYDPEGWARATMPRTW